MDALPTDLQDEIFNRLDLVSWVRSKAVCRSWRKTVLSAKSPPKGVPWLWENHTEAPWIQNMINMSEQATYTSCINPKVFPEITDLPFRYQCIGAFGPWLILIVKQSCKLKITDQFFNLFKQQRDKKKQECLLLPNSCFLYNPLSWEHLKLPRLNWLDPNDSSVEARLSGLPNKPDQPSNSSNCTVLAFTFTGVYVCNANGKAWKKVDYSFADSFISDAVFQTADNDKLLLYLISGRGKLMVFDVVGDDAFSQTHDLNSNILWENHKLPGAMFNLVVNSFGELLVIGKYRIARKEVRLNKITVHKLQQGSLMSVDDLGGGMIFIGDEAACYYSGPVPSNSFFTKDCVYYLEWSLNGSNVEYELNRFRVGSSVLMPNIYGIKANNTPYLFMPVIT